MNGRLEMITCRVLPLFLLTISENHVTDDNTICDNLGWGISLSLLLHIYSDSVYVYTNIFI